jgi:hypothetical protein
MDPTKLKERKAELEKQRDDYARQAQAQIERFSGAIAMLEELIAQAEHPPAPEVPA